MHIHRLADPNLPPSQETPFPPFPVNTLRLWDNVGWSSIEPRRNTYNWTRMDSTIAKAQANGVSDFIFTFGYVPQWASSNPTATCGNGSGSCAPPADIAYLDEFAQALVRRYCGVVKYYETWNEPSSPAFWNGTNASFLTVTQHIYNAVKDPANCGCTNGQCSPGGGASPNKALFPPIDSTLAPRSQQWLQNWLSFAGSRYRYADIVAFHGYGYESNPEQIATGVAFMRTTVAPYGLASAEIWDTEGSWANVLASQDQQASWVIRFQIMQAYAGVSRFTWYAYDNCLWGTLYDSSFCQSYGGEAGLHQPATAYATVQQWLTGATLQSCASSTDGTWYCKLTRPGGYLAWAAWNSQGNSVILSAGETAGMTQYRDWTNQKFAIGSSVQLSSMPILLENQDAF